MHSIIVPFLDPSLIPVAPTEPFKRMDSEVNNTKNNFPFLTFAGLKTLDSEDSFVESSKRIIVDSNLDYKSLTNGLILELWSLVEAKVTPMQQTSAGKISKRQFAEILGCFLFKWSSGEEITKQFIKNYANPRDFNNLKRKISTNSGSEHNVWEKGIKLLDRIAARSDCQENMGESRHDENLADSQRRNPQLNKLKMSAGDSSEMVETLVLLEQESSTNQVAAEMEVDMMEEASNDPEHEIDSNKFCPQLNRLGKGSKIKKCQINGNLFSQSRKLL